MVISNLVQGGIGQVKGPFGENESVIFSTSSSGGRPPVLKLGISIDEKDLMTYGWAFPVSIDNVAITIGSTGRYELENDITIDTIIFPLGAPASVIIDYVVLDI